MDIIKEIINHPLYRDSLNRIKKLEEKRIYCKHDLDHFFSVSRLAYIYVLENNIDIKKEDIYIAGLIHDIGRWKEYETGVCHALASSDIGEIIIENIDISSDRKEKILNSIKRHRSKNKLVTELDKAIYYGDKSSRKCFDCDAYNTCKKRNEEINL